MQEEGHEKIQITVRNRGRSGAGIIKGRVGSEPNVPVHALRISIATVRLGSNRPLVNTAVIKS